MLILHVFYLENIPLLYSSLLYLNGFHLSEFLIKYRQYTYDNKTSWILNFSVTHLFQLWYILSGEYAFIKEWYEGGFETVQVVTVVHSFFVHQKIH